MSEQETFFLGGGRLDPEHVFGGRFAALCGAMTWDDAEIKARGFFAPEYIRDQANIRRGMICASCVALLPAPSAAKGPPETLCTECGFPIPCDTPGCVYDRMRERVDAHQLAISAAAPTRDGEPYTREELEALAAHYHKARSLPLRERGEWIMIRGEEYDRLLATARAGLSDTERLDFIESGAPAGHTWLAKPGWVEWFLPVSTRPVIRSLREAIDYARNKSTQRSGLPLKL